METYEEVIAVLDKMPRNTLLRVYKHLSQKRLWRSETECGTLRGDFEKYVAVMNGIVGADITSKTRKRTIVWGRYVVMHKLASDGYSVMDIGRMFGMSHCIVIHAREQVDPIQRMPRWFTKYETTIYNTFYKQINRK